MIDKEVVMAGSISDGSAGRVEGSDASVVNKSEEPSTHFTKDGSLAHKEPTSTLSAPVANTSVEPKTHSENLGPKGNF